MQKKLVFSAEIAFPSFPPSLLFTFSTFQPFLPPTGGDMGGSSLLSFSPFQPFTFSTFQPPLMSQSQMSQSQKLMDYTSATDGFITIARIRKMHISYLISIISLSNQPLRPQWLIPPLLIIILHIFVDYTPALSLYFNGKVALTIVRPCYSILIISWFSFRFKLKSRLGRISYFLRFFVYIHYIRNYVEGQSLFCLFQRICMV